MPAAIPSSSESTASPAIVLSDCTVRIGAATILGNISLTVPRARILGVLGANGAGKTTLLQVLSGQRQPSEGTLSVLGRPAPWRDRACYAQLGYVAQESGLYDELTVSEQLRLFATVYGLDHGEQAVTRVADLLGLTSLLHTRARTLSGGMRRRVVIARALVHGPDLLLIDEPTLAVDGETRQLIWSHLRGLRAQGRSVVISTNYLEEASAVCDQVVVLREGRVWFSDAMGVLRQRLGTCIELDCPAGSCESVRNQLSRYQAVRRIDATSAGLRIQLDSAGLGELMSLLGSIPEITRFSSGPGDLQQLAIPEAGA